MAEPIEEKIDRIEKTVDKLAVSVANGFSSVDKRFNNLEASLKFFKTETGENFDKLNEKMDNLTDVVIGNHDKRIEALEEKVLD